MSSTPPRIDSIGYEGATVDQVVAALVGAGVELLVDVRIRPQSRKPGLSKTPLSAALRAAGIEYLHLRDLGTPSDIRSDFRAGNLERGRARYREYLQSHPDAHEALDCLASVAAEQHAAVLCYERSEAACHRLVTLEELERLELARAGEHLRP